MYIYIYIFIYIYLYLQILADALFEHRPTKLTLMRLSLRDTTLMTLHPNKKQKRRRANHPATTLVRNTS